MLRWLELPELSQGWFRWRGRWSVLNDLKVRSIVSYRVMKRSYNIIQVSENLTVIRLNTKLTLVVSRSFGGSGGAVSSLDSASIAESGELTDVRLPGSEGYVVPLGGNSMEITEARFSLDAVQDWLFRCSAWVRGGLCDTNYIQKKYIHVKIIVVKPNRTE